MEYTPKEIGLMDNKIAELTEEGMFEEAGELLDKLIVMLKSKKDNELPAIINVDHAIDNQKNEYLGQLDDIDHRLKEDSAKKEGKTIVESEEDKGEEVVREKKVRKTKDKTEDETKNIRSLERYALDLRGHVQELERRFARVFIIASTSVQQEYHQLLHRYLREANADQWTKGIFAGFSKKSVKDFEYTLTKFGINEKRDRDLMIHILKKLKAKDERYTKTELFHNWLFVAIGEQKVVETKEHLKIILEKAEALRQELADLEKKLALEKSSVAEIIREDIPTETRDKEVYLFWQRYSQVLNLEAAKSVLELLRQEEHNMAPKERGIIKQLRLDTTKAFAEIINVSHFNVTCQRILSTDETNKESIPHLVNNLVTYLDKGDWLDDQREKELLVVHKPRIERDVHLLEENFLFIVKHLHIIAEVFANTLQKLNRELLFLSKKEQELFTNWRLEMEQKETNKDKIRAYKKMITFFLELKNDIHKGYAIANVKDAEKPSKSRLSILKAAEDRIALQKSISKTVGAIWTMLTIKDAEGYFSGKLDPKEAIMVLLPTVDFTKIPPNPDEITLPSPRDQKQSDILRRYISKLIERIREHGIMLKDIEAIT